MSSHRWSCGSVNDTQAVKHELCNKARTLKKMGRVWHRYIMIEYDQTGSLNCCSRALTSKQHTVLLWNSLSYHHQEKVCQHANEECHHAVQHSSIPSNLNCPGHATLHALEGVSPSPIQPESITVWFSYVWPPQRKQLRAKNVGRRCQSCGVSRSGQGIHWLVCQWNARINAHRSTTSPKTIPEWVSFEQAS
jgi:hypothetical protein